MFKSAVEILFPYADVYAKTKKSHDTLLDAALPETADAPLASMIPAAQHKEIALPESDLVRFCRRIGIPEGAIVKIDQACHVKVNEEASLELDAIVNGRIKDLYSRGFYIDKVRYLPAFASASDRRKAEVTAIALEWREKLMNYLSGGMWRKYRHLAPRKASGYLGLMASSSRPWIEAFGVEGPTFDDIVVLPDHSIQVSMLADILTGGNRGELVVDRDIFDWDFTFTDGLGLVPPHYTNGENCTFRGFPGAKGALLACDVAKVLLANGKSTIVRDAWGHERDLTGKVVLFASTVKTWKEFGSYEELVTQYTSDPEWQYRLTVCVREHAGRSKHLSYQAMQTCIAATQDDALFFAKRDAAYINEFTKVNKAALMMGRDRAAAYRLYPALFKESEGRARYAEAFNKLRNTALGGKLLKSMKSFLVFPDPVAVCQAIAGDPVTGVLSANEISCALVDKEDVRLIRFPHAGCDFATARNTKKLNKFEGFCGFENKALFVSVLDAICYMLKADFDGDKLMLIEDPKIIDVIDRSQSVLKHVPYAWAPVGGAKPQFSVEAMKEDMMSIRESGKVGSLSNQLSLVWQNRDKVIGAIGLQKTHALIGKLVRAVNEDIDSAKGSNFSSRLTQEEYETIRLCGMRTSVMFAKYSQTADIWDPIWTTKTSPNDSWLEYRCSFLRRLTRPATNPVDCTDEEFDYHMLMAPGGFKAIKGLWRMNADNSKEDGLFQQIAYRPEQVQREMSGSADRAAAQLEELKRFAAEQGVEFSVLYNFLVYKLYGWQVNAHTGESVPAARMSAAAERVLKGKFWELFGEYATSMIAYNLYLSDDEERVDPLSENEMDELQDLFETELILPEEFDYDEEDVDE